MYINVGNTCSHRLVTMKKKGQALPLAGVMALFLSMKCHIKQTSECRNHR